MTQTRALVRFSNALDGRLQNSSLSLSISQELRITYCQFLYRIDELYCSFSKVFYEYM